MFDISCGDGAFTSQTDIKKPKVRRSPPSGRGTFPENSVDAECSLLAHVVSGGFLQIMMAKAETPAGAGKRVPGLAERSLSDVQKAGVKSQSLFGGSFCPKLSF